MTAGPKECWREQACLPWSDFSQHCKYTALHWPGWILAKNVHQQFIMALIPCSLMKRTSHTASVVGLKWRQNSRKLELRRVLHQLFTIAGQDTASAMVMYYEWGINFFPFFPFFVPFIFMMMMMMMMMIILNGCGVWGITIDLRCTILLLLLLQCYNCYVPTVKCNSALPSGWDYQCTCSINLLHVHAA